ncbi:MAG: SDR family NAD(P)-dependent oxidoreductase [Porticoccaceae bacterium]|nr:SDR family NAD(P)-dependent oxidoreductase [Porticoccaceae bacterium]
MTDNIFSVKGRVALVSGASSGLGEHIAEMLAENGVAVVCAARRMDLLESLAARIKAKGGKALAVAMDVTDRTSVKAGFDLAEKEFGTPDILVCNAGATGRQPFIEMEEANWDHVLDVNVKGVFNLAQEGAQRLVAAGKPGNIINISSICAVSSFMGLTHYSASKGAVNQLTAVMGHELAEHGIRVNALAPGFLYTDLVADYYETPAGQADLANLPLKRAGKLSELDGAILLLASDAASYMSGSVITADAAHSVRLG